MRIRTIKPDFFLDEDLAGRPPLERLLFQALWLQADRLGRLEDKPRKIKTQALPYDDCDVDAMLSALDEAGFLVRYVVEGRKYIQIRTFEKHQRPNTREAPSTLPPPPTRPVRSRASTRMRVKDHGEGKGREQEGKGKGSVEPEVLALAAKVAPVLTSGGKVTVGLTDACKRFLAAGYEESVALDAVAAIETAKAHPEWYPEKCPARWAAEHNDSPGWVLRPAKVEDIAADYMRHGRRPKATAPPQPEESPRAAAERRAREQAEIEQSASLFTEKAGA